MKNRSFFMMALLALSLPFPGLRASQDTSITLEGVVLRQGTEEPIPDVRVTVIQSRVNESGAAGTPSSTAPLSGLTDSAGRFVIRNVPTGMITLRAQLAGYFGVPDGGISPDAATLPLLVKRDTPEVRLFLIPGGSVSGRVIDAAGKPMIDAPVQLLRIVYNNGQIDLTVGAPQKTTDDRGEYRLYRIPPGNYYIAVVPGGAGGQGNRPESDEFREVAIRTFYPSATEHTAATPVIVAGGQETSGIDIAVVTTPLVKVSGRIVSSLPPDPVLRTVTVTGVPGAEAGTVRETVASVSLIPHDRAASAGARAIASVNANTDGSFEFRDVLPGTYDVYARFPVIRGWGAQAPPERAVTPWTVGWTPVEVRRDNVDSVIVNLHQGTDLKGRIIVNGKPTTANIRFALLPEESTARINDQNNFARGVYNQLAQYQSSIEQDGSFTIPLVPEGRYRFQAAPNGVTAGQSIGGARPPEGAAPPPPNMPRLPPNAYIADIRQAGASVYDSGIVVGTLPISPIDVLVETNGGGVEGTVLGPDQKPVANVTVALVPPENRRTNTALYKTARTDVQGHFAISAIAPGSYTLFAWQSPPTGAYQNSQFLEKYEGRGRSVLVNAGISVHAEVDLIQ